ncbi:MAG: hypothetical protein HW375_20 [Anaerolineales bacterium]|nr:hypothetical protein [Anaerolineales bacterium]
MVAWHSPPQSGRLLPDYQRVLSAMDVTARWRWEQQGQETAQSRAGFVAAALAQGHQVLYAVKLMERFDPLVRGGDPVTAEVPSRIVYRHRRGPIGRVSG